MDTAASNYATIEALVAQLQHGMKEPEQLKQAVDDNSGLGQVYPNVPIEKNRIEHEAWMAAGCPNMEAKDGQELKEWREVGFPQWFKIKSLTTLEPVEKTESTDQADAHPSATLLESTVARDTSEKVLVDTAFGAREAIVSTPLPADKCNVLGGGPLSNSLSTRRTERSRRFTWRRMA
ncbi:hypothetical protein PG985_006106 [Apiospora marii]|uniref:Uncharacterized protein n=1 Tax=Apiospora marii TaxID=335849 RepID=A0ABR1S8F6_9PEZI